MTQKELYTLGIDIGSTTVKIAILDDTNDLVFSDYERHSQTLSDGQSISLDRFMPHR